MGARGQENPLPLTPSRREGELIEVPFSYLAYSYVYKTSQNWVNASNPLTRRHIRGGFPLPEGEGGVRVSFLRWLQVIFT